MQQTDLEINKNHWDARVYVHMQSELYNLSGFLKGDTSLQPTEIGELGSVQGKTLCHLQCHFGQDSISWARLGAQVTGVDFSPKAIQAAKSLCKEMNINVNFIESNVLEASSALKGETFDIVFTSYGTIGWLPDLQVWANEVFKLLKPGGTFYMIDFHPVVWMFNDELTEIGYSYFNIERIVEEISGSYADRSADIKTQSVGWNHPISEIINSLTGAGLKMEFMHEFGFTWYNIFPDLLPREQGGFKHSKYGEKLPMMYSFKFHKL
jgi:SAM-dependent methyltransferase